MAATAATSTATPLLEHLKEFRVRLVRCLIAVGLGFIGSYAFAEKLLTLILEPLIKVLPEGSTLIALTLPEKFFTVMKLSLVAGAFAVSPFIFYQIWGFVAPALYRAERRMVIPVAVASALFFVGGAFFGYYVVFPFGFRFFVDYAGEFVTIMPTISDYVSLALTLLIAFGVIFELPVFIFFLAALGLTTARALRKFQRWAILLAFVASAILTPTPDAVNQCLMAGPIIVLYEVGIWVAWAVGKAKSRQAAKETPDATDRPATVTPAPAQGDEPRS